MTRPACYIEGAALEISFADGRRNLQELIFDTVRAAGDDSGQPMHEIDSVVLAAHDLADGRSLSSMVTSPAAGACLRDEIRYGDDGAGALAAAVTRLEAATPAARSSRPGAGRVSTARTSSPGRCSSRSGPARWAWMSSCCPRCGPSCACPPAAGRDRPASGPRCGEWTAPARAARRRLPVGPAFSPGRRGRPGPGGRLGQQRPRRGPGPARGGRAGHHAAAVVDLRGQPGTGRPGRTPSTARAARPPRTATWSTTRSRCPCWPTCTRT
jgi:hypothetical protein